MKMRFIVPLVCMVLTGCSASVNESIQEEPAASYAETTAAKTENTAETTYGSSLTAAFAKRVDKHDFSIKLSSVQPGGAEVIEEVEVCGNVLHDVYKTTEGAVTGELFIVEGDIWSVTNEGTQAPVYAGFDNNYDAHVRECVFHCSNVADEGSFGGSTAENTEVIKGLTDGADFTFSYGSDGVLAGYDGCGAHYEVKEYREGIGSVEIPDRLKAAMEERERNG